MNSDGIFQRLKLGAKHVLFFLLNRYPVGVLKQTHGLGLSGSSGGERNRKVAYSKSRSLSPEHNLCPRPTVVEYLRLCLPYSRIMQPAMSLFDQIYIFVFNFIYSHIEHSY